MNEIRASDSQKNGTQEIRVLIDVSGSMKQNDPENLRISAIKLLINLLPEQVGAGFWVFAEETKLLITPGNATKTWKQQALKKIIKIHSRGRLTDIENALQEATQGWQKADKTRQRHLILLTDGMVDISRDFMKSADSRERIIDSVIPKLQQSGIRLHTIALSGNADKGLMKKLALATGGWNETIQSAHQLQRTFLKLFNKAVPHDALPISGNKFMIDSRVKEFSVLIFRKPGASDTRMVTPGELELSHVNVPGNVNWLHENNYDLVTVQNPEPGQWRIVAKTDPDNQIMIVTDLKLEINEIANLVSQDEALDIDVHLTDRGQLIIRPNFLKMLEITLRQKMPDGLSKEWEFIPAQGKPGFFHNQLNETLVSGKHELVISVDGKTFKREIKRTIEVIDTLIKVAKNIDKKNHRVILELIPDRNILDTTFMSVQASVTEPLKEKRILNIKQKQGKWLLELKWPKQGKRLLVNFSVTVKTREGIPVMPEIKPVFIESDWFEENREQGEESSTKAVNEAEQDEDTETEIEAGELDEPKEEAEQTTDWLTTGAMVAGGNIILIAVGFFVYRWQKKNNLKQQEKLLERLE